MAIPLWLKYQDMQAQLPSPTGWDFVRFTPPPSVLQVQKFLPHSSILYEERQKSTVLLPPVSEGVRAYRW